ncbi:hypothetical protein OBBRIDRAFT_838995 [Obba rivulosa]|uniref:Uncharacterized protein n=1 Tax=Obba rivulosa TaxID=1052685 RepID=A0A8E2DFX9_9APHY|nr:hypothetical protein OBBRIDRAFT_838995 [Obba rivulosa]
MSHHLLAVFSLGGGGPLIQAIYERHAVTMRLAFASPELINENNFGDHLGKIDFYDSYLKFFTGELKEKSVPKVLEECVFSAKANVELSATGKTQGMLNRLLAGLVHPFIHAGYGLEFGLPGIVAEASLFEAGSESGVAHLVDQLPKLVLAKTPGADQEAAALRTAGAHALTILARVFRAVVTIVRFAQKWLPDGTDAADFAPKIEELVWMNVIFYGIGGWAGRKTTIMNADFLLTHLITSLLFVPSYVTYLSHRSSLILLRSYFATCVAWYVA